MDLDVTRIDRTVVQLPYRDIAARHMLRTRPSWNYFEVVEVELANGAVGHGETQLYSGWGGEAEDSLDDTIQGRSAAGLLWDDRIGRGLEIALFDAVGRALGEPVHRLLGSKVRDRSPHSWWAMDMPAEDWLSECETALDRGYTNIKLKGRPWRDVRGIVDELCSELPEDFAIDIDFNGTLLDAERAIPVLREVASHPQVRIIEGPIPKGDFEGIRAIRDAIDAGVAVHYGWSEGMVELLAADICDGFVVGGAAEDVLQKGAVVDTAEKRLWLQLVGTGLTTLFSAHLGAVVDRATWPGISCHQLFEETLLVEPIEIVDGAIPVSDDPGLGYTVDTDAIEQYAIERPDEQPEPTRLIEVDWPDGPTIYFANYDPQMLDLADDEEMPYYQRGVETRLVPDDGSDQWERLHGRAAEDPVIVAEPQL